MHPHSSTPSVVTVTLNPTVDRVMEVPDFVVGGHLKGRLRSRLPAGKAINVSRTLAALGIANTAMGWVGADTGQAFEEAVRAAGVTPRFTPIAGAARENITIIDPQRHSETHIREAGPSITEGEIERLQEELRRTIRKDTLAVFTGSLADGLTGERFAGLLNACKERGARIVVDTSGEPLRTALAVGVWMIKPNRAELAELVGRPLDRDEDLRTAVASLRTRVDRILVSLGAEGAWCITKECLFKARADLAPERIKSTVGCGDALLGAFLAGLLAGDGQVGPALRQAVAVATASAMREEPAAFAQADVESMSITEEDGTL